MTTPQPSADPDDFMPGCSRESCPCHELGPICDEFMGGRFCPRCGWAEHLHPGTIKDRLHADTGTPLSETVSDGGYGEEGGVGTATPADPRAQDVTNRYGTCPDCGSPGYDPKLMNRPDQVECVNHCGGWTNPAADPAVTEALDFWQRKYRDENMARLAAALTPGEPRERQDAVCEEFGEGLFGVVLGPCVYRGVHRFHRDEKSQTWGRLEPSPPVDLSGYVINRFGSPVPSPDVDLTACPLSTCTNHWKPSCDSCGESWGHCADHCQDPTESHDEAGLRAEIYRLRAVFRWLDGHDQFRTARKAKTLGRQYGIASRTIAELRGRLARALLSGGEQT